MAAALWEALQQIVPDQPPRAPVDEWMTPGMGPDLYQMLEQMTQNPALNYSVGMVGPPSMPRGGGPWVNMLGKEKGGFTDLERAVNQLASGSYTKERLPSIDPMFGATPEILPPPAMYFGGEPPSLLDVVTRLAEATMGYSGGHIPPALGKDRALKSLDLLRSNYMKDIGPLDELWQILQRINPTSPNHPTMKN